MFSKLSGAHVFLLSLGGILGTTLVCFRFGHSSPTTVALILLIIVLLTAISTRLVYAIAAAFLATLSLDLFFFPPIGQITVADPQNWIALLVFCSTCLIVGQLSNQLRTQRDRLIDQQKEAERLSTLTRSLLMRSANEEMRRMIVNGSMQIFELQRFALYESASDTFYHSDPHSPFPEQELKNTDPPARIAFGDTEWFIVPLSLGHLRLGSMAYTRSVPMPVGTVQSWETIVALGLAQVQAQESAARTDAVRRSEELKSVMIDALAHDLKTPLTSIEAAASMLGSPVKLSATQGEEMVRVIQEESRGLWRLVDEAMHLARIDAKRLRLDLQLRSVQELVATAVAALGERAGVDRIALHLHPDLSPVRVDGDLLVQAIKQLLDNALKYAPTASNVSVSGTEDEGLVTIAIRDNGPGLTELEQSKVFEKFYRGRYDRSAIQGTGMGLAITREIMEAHGGSVNVRSYAGQGTEFYLSLAAASPTAAPSHELLA